jgi:4-carboxymuconolactone decarboxylase
MNQIYKTRIGLLSYGIILAVVACHPGNYHKETKMTTTTQQSIFPTGNPLPADYFTGQAFLHLLLAKDVNNEFALGSVTFQPGARTVWHTHPKGQVLIVIEGEGLYQEKGKPARRIRKGDVVNIPENIEHWHGATAQTKMVHIAITNYKGEENVTWLQPVSDQEYQAANTTPDDQQVTQPAATQTSPAQPPAPQHLNARQQSLISISALTAAGDLAQLKTQLNIGLDAGLTINEIKEILVQLYAYSGFPRSLNGINTFMAVLDDRKAKGIHDPTGKDANPINDQHKYQTGKKTLTVLTGKEEQVPAGANAFAPAIDSFLKEHLFADIFSRDILTFQQRELVTVAALAATSGVTPQLQAHIGMAMNTGVSQAQLQDAFTLIDNTIGKQAGDIARATLQKVLAAQN